MRMLSIVVVVAGCGGGASITVEPNVEITSTLCSVNSLGLVVVNVDYQVTADPGRGFVASVDLLDGVTPGQENNSFICGGWDATELGANDVGCQRNVLMQDETVTIEHLYNTQPGEPPGGLRVALLGSVVQVPGEDLMIANAQDTITCTVDQP
jgi:hypothetical protein